jgi:hypothetical protein
MAMKMMQPTIKPSKKQKKLIDRTIEKQLIFRLKSIGCVIVLFGLISLCYAVLSSPYPYNGPSIEPSDKELSASLISIPSDVHPETNEKRDLNLYWVTGIFAMIGTLCLVIAWRKKKKFIEL